MGRIICVTLKKKKNLKKTLEATFYLLMYSDAHVDPVLLWNMNRFGWYVYLTSRKSHVSSGLPKKPLYLNMKTYETEQMIGLRKEYYLSFGMQQSNMF